MAEYRRGNTYTLLVKLTKNKQPLDNSTVDKIEFTFGSVVKSYPGDAVYDADRQGYVVKFTQEDTFKFTSDLACQYRIKFVTGEVKSTNIAYNNVKPVLSEVIL